MKPLKIAVTGADGQLGNSLKAWVEKNKPNQSWHFFDFSDLDITDGKALNQLFDEDSWDYIVNCAAYTAVDLAEKEIEKTRAVNASAVKHLAELCKTHQSVLIHISTDFVFGGNHNQPYHETDAVNPLNIYGQTKYEGEQAIDRTLDHYFILRTGWLYSLYGNNFLKTMLRLSNEKPELGVVFDQIGTPTHTSVLVNTINKIIQSQSKAYGLYHIANEGIASWYDFTYEIFQLINSKCHLKPILSEAYPTPAQRPHYSVLNKGKVKTTFNMELPHWKESLQQCLLEGGFLDQEIEE